MPSDLIYSCAAAATFLGYWSKGLFSGRSIIITSPIIVIVGISINGSITAVERSGINTISDFSTAAYP